MFRKKSRQVARPLPGGLSPMLLSASREPPPDREPFGFEVKWDGMRALAYIERDRLRVFSRHGNDFTAHYPELDGLRRAVGRSAVLDGEVVALGADGRPSFERLQQRIRLEQPSAVAIRRLAVPVTFIAFDVLALGGKPRLDASYADRRALLDQLALDGPHWRAPAYQVGAGARLRAATRELGIEGLVAKRLDSPYRPGQRTLEWLKLKNYLRQEFVVGGIGRDDEGNVEKLLVGHYDAAGQLVYAGAVELGLDADIADALDRMEPLIACASCPFTVGVKRWKRVRFVAPKVVIEVQFAAWVEQLRDACFKGFRLDKPARDVVREP